MGQLSKVYLNGNLEGSVATTAVPRSDSISHAGLATGLNSTGVATAGFFPGRIDEVRIWNIVRSQADIQASHEFRNTDPNYRTNWSLGLE